MNLNGRDKFGSAVSLGTGGTVRVVSCGRERCISSKIVYSPHRIRFSLHYVTDGRGYIECRGHKTLLGSGNLFLLFTQEESRYYPDPVKPWSYTWVDFDGAGAERFFRTLGITPEQPYLYVGKDRELSTCFAEAAEDYERMGIVSLKCTALFLTVLSRIVVLSGADADAKPSKTDALVNNALTFVRNNYWLELSVKDVAASVHSNPDYLSHVFCKATGQTLKAYIVSLKMKYAAVLLSGGKHSVGGVAGMVGYKDPLHFSKAFAAYHNIPPSEYIKVNKDIVNNIVKE